MNNQDIAGNNSSKPNFIKGKKCIELAVAQDSTYVDALVWLSHYYINIFFPMAWYNPQLQINYLDTGKYYAEKALKYDPDNDWATGLMERYYNQKGMEKEAEVYKNKQAQIKKDFNFPEYANYHELLERASKSEDYYTAIKYYYKYLEAKPDLVETPIYLIHSLYNLFECTGYPELAKAVAKEILYINNDSIGYRLKLTRLNYIYENDTNLKFLSNVNKKVSSSFNEQIKFYNEQIKFKIPDAQKYYSHFNLAEIYAIMGEKEAALNYLKQVLKRKPTFPFIKIKELKIHPLWDSIRNEPEFQKILAELESKYEKEHKRIGGLMRDLGIIVQETD